MTIHAARCIAAPGPDPDPDPCALPSPAPLPPSPNPLAAGPATPADALSPVDTGRSAKIGAAGVSAVGSTGASGARGGGGAAVRAFGRGVGRGAPPASGAGSILGGGGGMVSGRGGGRGMSNTARLDPLAGRGRGGWGHSTNSSSAACTVTVPIRATGRRLYPLARYAPMTRRLPAGRIGAAGPLRQPKRRPAALPRTTLIARRYSPASGLTRTR